MFLNPRSMLEVTYSILIIIIHFSFFLSLSLLFLIWCGVFFYFGACSRSAIICNILIVAVIVTNLMYLLVLAQRCVREWGKRNKSQLSMVMKRLHLDAISPIGHVKSNDTEIKSGELELPSIYPEPPENGDKLLEIRL